MSKEITKIRKALDKEFLSGMDFQMHFTSAETKEETEKELKRFTYNTIYHSFYLSYFMKTSKEKCIPYEDYAKEIKKVLLTSKNKLVLKYAKHIDTLYISPFEI